jgi:hypothetical protein
VPSLLDALWQVESGGIPGRRGPQTKYGQPLGIGQTLPGTAREMAQKLGLPWRPDLLTSPTPEGADYQRAVSQAYLEEGKQRTGNTRDALRYYHGGPNRRLWGPKTDAYADKVLSLAGGGEQPMQATFNPGPPMMQPQPLAPDEQLKPAAPTSIMDIMSGLPPATVPAAAKPKAFDQGGKGWAIAGIIADAIASGFGAKPGFAPTYLAGQEDNRTLELWREKAAADRADRLDTANSTLARQIALEQWKRANPEKPDPTSLERNIAYLKRLNPNMSDAEAFAIARQNINRPLVIGNTPYGLEAGDDDGGDTGTSRPQPGTVEDGFVFMGGDPSIPENWRQQ